MSEPTDEPIPSGIDGMDGPAGHPEQIFCDCGNAWFEGGLVAFERGMLVNGVGGFLRCSECGAPFAGEGPSRG